jgi:hypothetical protein
MGIRDWLSRLTAEPTVEAPELAPKPRPTAAPQHRVADVAGTQERLVSHYEFDQALRSLPLGQVSVTMRLEANEENPFGVSAYIGDSQVGYLRTKDWAATDPWVSWMRRLDAAGIWPRFVGTHEIGADRGAENIVNVLVPVQRELSSIAKRLIAGD